MQSNNIDGSIEIAKRGFIATLECPVIKPLNDKNGSTDVFNIADFNFIQEYSKGNPYKAPETVNPSLWHQAQLLSLTGLFEVTPGKIYQVRGFDLANITFIRTPNNSKQVPGWIIVDTLTRSATAVAAIKLFEKHLNISLGKLNNIVYSIIITHSHIDHFGGVVGVIDYIGYKPLIIAPEGFMKESISENILAGNAMSRRAEYMFGNILDKSVRGSVTTGLGLSTAVGEYGIVKPDIIISSDLVITIESLELIFSNIPNAEAPAELIFYIPSYQTMFTSEIINHTMHNLYTLRGAKVRNGLIWSKYIDEIIKLYGAKVQLSLGSHHWPVWNNREIINYWTKQRDLYRFIHDQTLQYANNGYNMTQIANMIKLPDSLNNEWFNHGYYGSLSHNIKAQYQLYFGWFDGNPANLDPLPDPEESRKYVELAGGPESMYNAGLKAHNNKEYRWAATILNKLVMATDNNQIYKNLLANVYTEIGFKQENAVWRNFYLSAAKELRQGVINLPIQTSNISIIENLSLEEINDYIATRIDYNKVKDTNYTFIIEFTDIGQISYLELSNGVLNNRVFNPNNLILNKYIDAGIKMKRSDLNKIVMNKSIIPMLIDSRQITGWGDTYKFIYLLQSMVEYNPNFNIVTPI